VDSGAGLPGRAAGGGRPTGTVPGTTSTSSGATALRGDGQLKIAFVVMLAIFVLAPFVVYPVFLMKVMCFALFACAFNLLLGFGGLLSFGHAMFLGTAGYASATRQRSGA
jgi:hypothetical protein